MSRTVFCRKYQQEMEGLDKPPFPGAKGQELFASVSKQAWQEWIAHQTMLINEKKLNMMNAEHRALLQTEMVSYLFEDGDVQIEGYVPPSQN